MAETYQKPYIDWRTFGETARSLGWAFVYNTAESHAYIAKVLPDPMGGTFTFRRRNMYFRGLNENVYNDYLSKFNYYEDIYDWPYCESLEYQNDIDCEDRGFFADCYKYDRFLVEMGPEEVIDRYSHRSGLFSTTDSKIFGQQMFTAYCNYARACAIILAENELYEALMAKVSYLNK